MEDLIKHIVPELEIEDFGEYCNNEINALTYKIIGAAMEVDQLPFIVKTKGRAINKLR